MIEIVSGPHFYAPVRVTNVQWDQGVIPIGICSHNNVITVRLSFSPADTRLFYIFRDYNSIWCSQYDIQLLHSNGPLHNIIGSISSCRKHFQPSEYLETLLSNQSNYGTSLRACSQYISRGPFSSHFGHFIVDNLPVLLLIRDAHKLGIEISDKYVLTQNLQSWNMELSNLMGLEKKILENIVVNPFYNSTENIIHENISIKLQTLDLSFISISRKSRDRIITSNLPPLTKILDRQKTLTVDKRIRALLLPRSLNTTSPRWINYDSCENSNLVVYTTLFPEKLGPKLLSKYLNQNLFNIIIAPIGSASYQLFLMGIQAEIVIIRGAFNCDKTWESALRRDYVDSLYEMRSFKNRFWLVYRESEISSCWNESFTYHPSEIDEIVRYVCTNDCSGTLSGGINLLSPMSQ